MTKRANKAKVNEDEVRTAAIDEYELLLVDAAVLADQLIENGAQTTLEIVARVASATEPTSFTTGTFRSEDVFAGLHEANAIGERLGVRKAAQIFAIYDRLFDEGEAVPGALQNLEDAVRIANRRFGYAFGLSRDSDMPAIVIHDQLFGVLRG